MSWTQEQANAYWARQVARSGGVTVSGDAPEVESPLHDQILAECKRRGWIAIHSRMDLASTVTVGAPDFVIMAHGGYTFYIECKSKTGKISLKQAALHAQAKHLGHFVFTVRSFQQFLEIIR